MYDLIFVNADNANYYCRHGLVHKPIRQKVAPKEELQPPSTHITILEPSSTQPKFTPASELVPSKITEREQVSVQC